MEGGLPFGTGSRRCPVQATAEAAAALMQISHRNVAHPGTGFLRLKPNHQTSLEQRLPVR